MTQVQIKTPMPHRTASPPTIPGDDAGRQVTQAPRILVVDDEPEIVDEIVELLNDEGLQSIGVTSAAAAIETFRAQPEIEIVISDIRMPGMDGLEMARQLKSESGYGRSLFLIVVTGHAGMTEAIEALRLGAEDFLLKPLDPDHLLHAVQRSLRLASAQQTEVALKESEVRNRTLIEHAPEAILVIDKESGLIVDANPQANAMLGLDRVTILGSSLLDVSLLRQGEEKSATDVLAARMQEAVAGESPRFEWVCRGPGDTEIHCDARLVALPSADSTQILASLVDITDRKRLEAELIASNMLLERRVTEATRELRVREARLRAISDIIPVGLAAWQEPNGPVVLANQGLSDILGISSEDAIGNSAFTFLSDSDAGPTLMREFHQHGAIRDREVKVRRSDGSEAWALLSLTRIDVDDDPMLLMALIDIDLLKRAQDELTAAKEAADSASQAKSEFLSRMSHELRTPLNAILGYGQLLEADGMPPLNDDQQRAVHQICHAGGILLDLISEILDLSRIDSGTIPIMLEPVGINDLIAECVLVSRPSADARSVTLTFEAEKESGLAVEADVTRLRQVLLNLLSNAVNYNRDGGSVHVTCMAVNEERMRVSVTDTGPGIPKSFIGQLFDPFTRLAQESNRVEGTGIGLTIAKRLVGLMGGTIGVESEEGAGSTFWIELKIASGAPIRPQRTAPDRRLRLPPEIKGARVICVEDNQTNADLMAEVVASIGGIDLLLASDADTAIQLAIDTRPDLILMDINLPGKSGTEALAQLRSDPRTRAVPVVAITADALPESVNAGIRAGFALYLTKPLDIGIVKETIIRFLGKGPAN